MRIEENISLKPYNTFGIEETSSFFCEVNSSEHLQLALSFAKAKNLDFLVLGGGSNVLITKPYSGLVIHIQNKGIEILDENKDQITIHVAAGENWHELVMQTLKKGWYGLENLSLIPGSVGAAPMQNIGAYGVEAKQFIRSVTYWDLQSASFKNINSEDCEFGYRESIFKNKLKDKAIIWAVDFVLSKNPLPKTEYGDIQKVLEEKGIKEPNPLQISEAVVSIRQSKLPDPKEIGNAGSFFKNPVVEKSVLEAIQIQYPEVPFYPAGEGLVKIPAGWLIEKAGWKGKRIENYGVHARQALVLVNYGGATGNQILQLSKDIQADIFEKFGISLKAEVNLV
jgi:UDP-N-acetylmuramate dehydrogenase